MKDIPIRKISTTLNEPAITGSFMIRAIGDILNGKDLVHNLHRHDFFFILAVQNGKGNHKIDFKDYKVQNNSIFILRPGQVHQLTLKADSIGFLAEFDAAFYLPKEKLANQRLIKAGNKGFCAFEADRFKKIQDILSHIFNEYALKQEGYIEVIKADLDIFFIEFMRQSDNPNGNSKSTGNYTQERFEEFITLTSANITTHKQVSQYADLLNLSTYQLNAITKTTVGKPASELINEQIVLEAKRYLLATPNQVKDIADHLGYEDISYFIRFFKKHTAYSPEAFRKKFQ
ncbi:MAG: helix-turn-helix transcriptional regulator [Flavobacterium sp.]|uniref:helix-turn-helix transcriptional regulator n=1 Tax=Flavobacterium sp. TaxID=239 RepID=UPI00326713C2